MREKIKEKLAESLGLDVADIEEAAALAEYIQNPDLPDLLETFKQDMSIEVPFEELKEVETVADFIDLLENNAQE